MPTTLAEILFWSAATVIVVAQLLILRSTRRGMKIGPAGSGSPLEWTFAVLPALCLVALLFWTWHTMHAGTFHFESKTPSAGVSA
jgi:heme/copper-type cytochrome/quinol oxidase subunit 2